MGLKNCHGLKVLLFDPQSQSEEASYAQSTALQENSHDDAVRDISHLGESVVNTQDTVMRGE